MHGLGDVGHVERGAGSIHDTMKKAKAPHHTVRGNLFCKNEIKESLEFLEHRDHADDSSFLVGIPLKVYTIKCIDCF